MEDQYSGFIVVRLAQESASDEADIADLRTLATKRGLDKLSRVLEGYPQCETGRLVSSLSPSQILELENKVRLPESKPRRSFLSYWRLNTRTIPDPDRLVKSLLQLDVVDLAYRELAVRNLEAPPPSSNPFARHQFHLDPAPVGIDARFAQTHRHGSGASVGFVDLEQGWIFNHEDLPPIVPLPGVSRDVRKEFAFHGTAVIGIVAGLNNNLGILGIAPKLRSVSVTSHFRKATGEGTHVVDAIVAVLPHMTEGDVLLIEWQSARNSLPADSNPAVRDAIDRACHDFGIVVVEAAGNGNTDLDAIPGLNPNDPAEDSGAIMVGACHSSLDPTRTAHDRWIHPDAAFHAGSNFGARVDCHAFGEHIVTAGPAKDKSVDRVGNGTRATNQYRRDFGGTSAAAAIVAGAAVALQGMHKGVKGRPLSSAEMRAVFRAQGTPQRTGVPGNIGLMPDLKKAAATLQL
jgi:hypothetical protein